MCVGVCVSPFIPLHCILLRSVLLFLFIIFPPFHFVTLFLYVCVCVCVCVSFQFRSVPETQNTFQYLKKVIADVDVSYKIVIDILYKVLTLNTTNNVLLLNHILLHLKKLPPEWVVFSNWNFKVCVSFNYPLTTLF